MAMASQQQPQQQQSDIDKTLHALVLPHPLQGHITPLLHLSLKLASSYDVSITFIVTEHILSKMKMTALPPTLKLFGLADNLPQHHPRESTFLDAFDAMMGMETSMDSLLQDFSSQGQLPSFIIADTFACWCHKLAVKYRIPHVAFATTNVAALAVMSSTAKLIDLGILPLKTVDGSSKFVDQLITCTPGLPPLRPLEMPYSMRGPHVSHYRIQFLISQFADLSKAAAVMVNSVTELEETILQGLEHKAPTFCIGPSLLLGGGDLTAQRGMRTSLWPEQEECLPWLDKQVSGSVLYISFGSVATTDKAQLAELAFGLEASEQPFLWVIRPGSFEGTLSDLLPSGYFERTKNKGYIVSWCPQLSVLAHRAVGGFMTHCGWNSILENLCLGGVPMICWPDAAEQALNAKLIVDVWKVGLKVKHEEDMTVKREEVGRVVRAVMQEEGAKELKSKASELKNMAKRAVQEGGSSMKNIEKVLEIVSSAKIENGSM